MIGKSCIKKFLRDEQGAELAEFAVAIALLIAIALVVYQILGNAIVDRNNGTGARITSASWTP